MAPHDRFQLDEILFDLGRDLPDVARRGVGPGDASRQSCPGDARGVVIPQVDGEERSRHALTRRLVAAFQRALLSHHGLLGARQALGWLFG